MGKGGSTTTTTNNYDPVASGKMADIAERQQGMAEDQWQMYKDYFQNYEIEAAKANSELLPFMTAASQAELKRQQGTSEANATLQPSMTKASQAQLEADTAAANTNTALQPLMEESSKAQLAYNEAASRENTGLLPDMTKATRAQLGYNAAAAKENEALLPTMTEATRAQLGYNTAAANANTELLPGAVTLTKAQYEGLTPIAKRYYDETGKGIDVGRRMDEAGNEVVSAMKLGESMRRREASRYGIDPGSTAFGNSVNKAALETARGVAGARTGARRLAEDENYNRLGVALGTKPSSPVVGQGNILTGQGNIVTGQGAVTTNQGNVVMGNGAVTTVNNADPYARAAGSYSGAAATYAPLATRVLASTREGDGGGFMGLMGNVLGQGAGAYAGAKGASLGGG